MFKTDLQKKIAITAISLFVLICSLLLIFNVVTIYVLWAILFVLPIIAIADICFVTLPVTIPMFFVMIGNSLITKNYEKFNRIYEVILVMIIVGIVNYEIDSMLNMKTYIMQTRCLRVYWVAYLGVALVCGCLFTSRKKDTRLYMVTPGILIVFYLLYRFIESFE